MIQVERCIFTEVSLFQILLPYRLLQNIEYSSLCYMVGPCWLFIVYIVVCICQCLELETAAHSSILAAQSHGQRRLVDYGP